MSEPPADGDAGVAAEPAKSSSAWKSQIAIGIVLALAGAVIGRVVGVIPNPFGGGGGGPAPSGSIRIGELLSSQTRGMFFGTETTAKPNEQFGFTIAVTRTSASTSSHECRIVWSYIDPSVPTTVGDPSLVDQQARDVVGDATACDGGARIWVPLKATLEMYERVRIRVELTAGDTHLGVPVETGDIRLG